MKVLSKFNFDMVSELSVNVFFTGLTTEQAKRLVGHGGVESYVDDSATAAVFSEQLGTNIPPNDVTLGPAPNQEKLTPGQVVLLGQTYGTPLKEATGRLPWVTADIQWVMVEIGMY